MLKKYKFLILFFVFFVFAFCIKSHVFAATTLDWKDLPSGCPTPTEVYNSLPADQKSAVSVDKYAFFSYTYSSDNKNWRGFSYIFTPATSHFADEDGIFRSDGAFVRVIFQDKWEFYSVLINGYNDAYHSLDNHKADYYFTTFNIYADRSYSEDNILFLQTTPPPISMGEIVRQNQDIVLKQVVLLLPIVLVTLVSLIGLKKALTMLFHFLRKS